MSRTSKYPLQDFVYRVLVRRIALAGLAMAAVIAAIAYGYERSRVSDSVVHTAMDRVAVIEARAREFRDEQDYDGKEAFQAALQALDAVEYQKSLGHFVYALFYVEKPHRWLEWADDSYPSATEARRLVQETPRRYPEEGVSWHTNQRIGGDRVVRLIISSPGQPGEAVVYVDAVFLVTSEAVAAMRWRAIKSALYAVAIVLLTTGVLFPVILALMRKLAVFSSDLLEANLETLQVLGCAVAKRDSDTDAHNYRVTIYAVRLAESVGLSSQAIQGLIKGAFLHDVGKIGIRDDILLKPGRLTDDEYRVMKTHVDHGLDIVGRSRWLRDALKVVGGHHEKVAGDGYPEGAVGEDIPAVARIFAIADVFDALTSRRPYKEPYPVADALHILEEGRGNHFDADLLDRFSKIAESLHHEFGQCEAELLQDELHSLTAHYFTADLASLKY